MKLNLPVLSRSTFSPLMVMAETSPSTSPSKTNPDIFSITPKTGVFTFRNMSAPLRTSARAMSCGVVTITAPDIRSFCVSVNWISPVPGGKSKIITSNSPHFTSRKNCSVILATNGPRQMTGVSFPLINPKLMTFIPNFSKGINFLSCVNSGCSFSPRTMGRDGP